MRIIFAILSLLLMFPPSPALAAPYPKLNAVPLIMDNPQTLNKLVNENPMYIFNFPYWENRILSPQDITKIHSRLPDTPVILHLSCCTLFDQKKLTSPTAKIAYASQNTQAEFDEAWQNHQDIFLKDKNGEYVSLVIEPNGNLWINPGDAYAVDIASPYFQQLFYKTIRRHIINENFDGVYLDVMYPVWMSTFYSARPSINGQPLTNTEWQAKLISLSTFLQNKKATDPSPKVKNALIITNSVGGGPGDGEDPIDRIQFNRDLKTQGVQIENYFAIYPPTSVAGWLKQVDTIGNITSLNNSNFRGWLNSHAPTRLASQELCDKLGLFSYASFLLGNNSPNFAFYLGCKIPNGNKVDTKEPTIELTHVDLGKPTEAYRQLNTQVYIRRFDNGLVAVNPTDGSATFQTQQRFKDAYGSTFYPAYTPISLAPYSGLVLLSPSQSPAADLNGDGVVNLFDYSHLLANFGNPYTIFDYTRLLIALRK